MQKLKNILSVFILLVFLFPLAEKGIHDFSHINETHCISSDKHFHSPEHHCEICDFTNDFNGLPSFHHSDLLISKPADLDFFFTQNNILLQEKHFHSLRAPPSLV
ncbi:MAG: hypothetical protein A3F72_15025 [Bacteroidetes bacterium RIFCSPLOWO2_12_FULL_35_15]|nr:MAG: hypothetical protein A3F72_15025 [Bacteroidetes bacterium RIFCSPLOWO2_12_FULL_35_15]